MLKFPPLKQLKITDYITYHCKNKNNTHIYNMIDIKTGALVGKMKARPEIISDKSRRFSPNAEVYHSFFIDRLFAYTRGSGVGKAFIKIAKKESFRNLCLGNIHTIASSLFDKQNPPYIFFRKQGFNFNKYSTVTAKKIDDCIKHKTQINICGDFPMYIEADVDISGQSMKRAYELKLKFSDIFRFR